MFNLFNRNKTNKQSKKLKAESPKINSISRDCIIRISTLIESIEDKHNSYVLFECLKHIVQIGQEELVLKYINDVPKDNNKDLIYIWSANFQYRNNESKFNFYLNKIINESSREYLINESKKESFNKIKNTKFNQPQKLITPNEIVDFFKVERTSEDVRIYIDQIVQHQKNLTKGKDKQLWNIAYYLEKIVYHLVHQNKIEFANIVIEQFPSKQPKWSAISEIALNIGKTDVEASLKLIKDIKDSRVKSSTILKLALNQYSEKDYSTSLLIINKLSKSKSHLKNSFFVHLVEKLVRDTKLEEAKDILNLIDKNSTNNLYDAILIIITGELLENNEKNIFKYVESLESIEYKVKYLSAIYAIKSKLENNNQQCLINYFLPERFFGFEIEFWNIYKKTKPNKKYSAFGK